MRIINFLLNITTISFCFLVFTTKVFSAQEIDNKILNELRKRYDTNWQSIYLTNHNLCDITQLLRNRQFINKLSQEKYGDMIPKFKNFLENFVNEEFGKIEILIFQIELRNLKAGYIPLKGKGGIITQQPWTPLEVFKIAYWSDRFLNEHYMFTVFYYRFIESEKLKFNNYKRP